MNVDHLAGVFGAQVWRQDLHVARQYHDFSIMLFNQTRNLGKRRLFVLGVNRYMVVRNTVPLDHAAQVIVVGYDARDFTIQFVAVPAVQQIRQAVRFATGHQYNAFLLRRVCNAPHHRKLFGDWRKCLTKGLYSKR